MIVLAGDGLEDSALVQGADQIENPILQDDIVTCTDGAGPHRVIQIPDEKLRHLDRFFGQSG
ncbi:hypothetical protein [Schaalia odontolytica]